MTRKASSRKLSFLLAASLLTTAVPATTQADCNDGMLGRTFEITSGVLVGAYGIANGVLALRSTYVFWLFLSVFDETPSKNLSSVPHGVAREIVGGLIKSSIISSVAGAVSIFCLKRAYKKLFGKKKGTGGLFGCVEKSEEDRRLDKLAEAISVRIRDAH